MRVSAIPNVTLESVYNGHLRLPMTLTPVAERLEVELSIRHVEIGIRFYVLEIEPLSPTCEANALPLSHRGGLTISLLTKT